jgi:hypothetical protein
MTLETVCKIYIAKSQYWLFAQGKYGANTNILICPHISVFAPRNPLNINAATTKRCCIYNAPFMKCGIHILPNLKVTLARSQTGCVFPITHKTFHKKYNYSYKQTVLFDCPANYCAEKRVWVCRLIGFKLSMSNNKTCVHDRCLLETRTLFETERGSPSG